MHLEPIELPVRGRTLRGSHYLPPGTGPFPTTILHHGFGGQRTEAGRSFVQLAAALLDHGIAVVAMDRAGHGESDGEFASTTVTGDVEDCIEIFDRVSRHGAVDPSNLHVMGTSLGAVIASVVAAERAPSVRSLTMWSPAALFVDEITSGFLQGKPIADVDADGYFDFRGLRVGPAFFDDARQWDVYGRAEAFDGPVRVLHGDQDFIPSRYAEAYRSVYGDRVRYDLIAGGDHCWETVPARDTVIGETVAFVSQHASTV